MSPVALAFCINIRQALCENKMHLEHTSAASGINISPGRDLIAPLVPHIIVSYPVVRVVSINHTLIGLIYPAIVNVECSNASRQPHTLLKDILWCSEVKG